MQGQYSLRSPAVKRLMREAQELSEPTAQFHAQPLEDNLFEWHFTIRGPDGTEFEGGVYHGRIILPPDYPMKPPSIIILTSNGRFDVNTKICLSISGHHPESWQPSWSIRTALLAIIGFMPTHGGGAIGSLDYTPDERKRLAKRSQEYKCPQCGAISNILRPVSEVSEADTEEAKELASQINFQAEQADKKGTTSDKPSTTDSSSGGDSASTSTENTASSAPTVPGANPWSPNNPMARFPFMPFMRPAVTSDGSGSGSSTSSSSQSGMQMLQMSAIHAAMQQHMRNQYLSRYPQPGQAAAAGSGPSTTTSSSTGSQRVSASVVVSSSSQSANAAGSGTENSGSSSSNPSSTTTTTTTTGARADGLRQRPPASRGSSSPNRMSQTAQSAELPRRARRSESSNVVTTTLIIILAIAFVALLIRRLSIMGYVHSDQDADL